MNMTVGQTVYFKTTPGMVIKVVVVEIDAEEGTVTGGVIDDKTGQIGMELVWPMTEVIVEDE